MELKIKRIWMLAFAVILLGAGAVFAQYATSQMESENFEVKKPDNSIGGEGRFPGGRDGGMGRTVVSDGGTGVDIDIAGREPQGRAGGSGEPVISDGGVGMELNSDGGSGISVGDTGRDAMGRSGGSGRTVPDVMR